MNFSKTTWLMWQRFCQEFGVYLNDTWFFKKCHDSSFQFGCDYFLKKLWLMPIFDSDEYDFESTAFVPSKSKAKKHGLEALPPSQGNIENKKVFDQIKKMGEHHLEIDRSINSMCKDIYLKKESEFEKTLTTLRQSLIEHFDWENEVYFLNTHENLHRLDHNSILNYVSLDRFSKFNNQYDQVSFVSNLQLSLISHEKYFDSPLVN